MFLYESPFLSLMTVSKFAKVESYNWKKIILLAPKLMINGIFGQPVLYSVKQ